MLSKLNQALCEVQETVRANESLRADNQAMQDQIAQLKSRLAKQARDEDQYQAQELKSAELTKRNILLETENQLLKQQMKEMELQVQLNG